MATIITILQYTGQVPKLEYNRIHIAQTEHAGYYVDVHVYKTEIILDIIVAILASREKHNTMRTAQYIASHIYYYR